MSELKTDKKTIKTQMEKADKEFEEFFKTLLNRKSKIYVISAVIRLSESMVAVNISLNQLRYMEIEKKINIDKMPKADVECEKKEESKKTGKGSKVKSENDAEIAAIHSKRSKMILELYDITELRESSTLQWRKKIQEMAQKVRGIPQFTLQEALNVQGFMKICADVLQQLE